MSAAKDIREIADVVKEAADFLGTIVEQLPRQPLVDELGGCAHWLRETAVELEKPIDMILHCPACLEQHIDAPDHPHYGGMTTAEGFTPRWDNPPHRSHKCKHCGFIWRPADVATNGVAAIKTKGKDDSPIAQPRRDSDRLDWMQFHSAHVAWGNDDEVCSVDWSDRDGRYRTALFTDWRAAIDAAMGGHFREVL